MKYENDTWIEPEEYAYPDGGFKRKARVRLPSGKYGIVKCSIADTFFSTPARAKINGKQVNGFISMDDKEELVFTQYNKV